MHLFIHINPRAFRVEVINAPIYSYQPKNF